MEMCALEDMLPGYSLPSMAPEGHDLSCHYKKRKRWGKGVGLPFYRVAAMLLVSCCAFRRKRTNSAIALTRKMSNVSAARWRGTTTAGANSATASGTSREDGVEGRDKHQQRAEAGAASPRVLATPLPFPSQERVRCAPKESGHNLA